MPIQIPLTTDAVVIVDDRDASLAILINKALSSEAFHSTNLFAFTHKTILSRVLGRPLQKDERVCFQNGNLLDYRRENLLIRETYPKKKRPKIVKPTKEERSAAIDKIIARRKSKNSF